MIKKILLILISACMVFGSLPASADSAAVEEFLSQNGYSYPEIIPPAEHPRVFINSSDIPTIKANLSHEQNRYVYNSVAAKSELYSSGTLPPRAEGATTNLNTSYIEIMEACAFLYVIEGNTDKGNKAVSIAKNLISSLDNAPNSGDATRKGGQVIFSTALVYDWCYPLLSDDDKNTIIEGMLKHASLMEIGWPPAGGGDVLGHSPEAQLFKDLLAAGIAVYNENTDIYNMAAGRILSGFVPARKQAYNSFEFSEGNSYGSFRYAFELMSAYLFKAIGSNPFDESQKNPAYGMLYQRRPDGKYISTGDDVTKFVSSYDSTYSSVYFLAGNLYKDSYLKREYFRNVNYGRSYSMGIADISPVMHLVLNDVTVECDKTFRDFPLTMYSGGEINTLIARTSWEEGADSGNMLVKMNMQGYNYGNHQHMDAGHFDIYYKGNLAIDSGVYESMPFYDENGEAVTSLAYASLHDMNYHKRTVAHNSMLVYDPDEVTKSVYTSRSDGGQRLIHGSGLEPKTAAEMLREENKTSEIISCDYGPDVKAPAYSYIRANLTRAYSDKVSDYSRSFLFLNFFDDEYPGALLVLDNITSSDAAFKKSWLLHTEEEPVISESTVTAERTAGDYHGKLINNTLLPANPVIEKIGGEGKEFISNGVNYKAVPKSNTQEAGNWRIEISPANENEKDIFLNVLTAYDSDKKSAPLNAALLSETDDFAAVGINGRACYIAKNDSPVSSAIEINADESYTSYIFAGLKAGRWQLADSEGNTVKTLYSYESRNTLSFDIDSGKYTLSYLDEATDEPKSLYLFDNIKANTSEEVDVKINKMYESFKSKPLFKNGVLYLPAEELINKVNPEFSKNGDGVFVSGNKSISFYRINQSFAVNGATVTTENKTFSYDGVLYAPAVDFLRALGHSVGFDSIGKIFYVAVNTSEEEACTAAIENFTHKYDMEKLKHHISLDVKLSGLSGNESSSIALIMAGDTQGRNAKKLTLSYGGQTKESYPYYIGQAELVNNTAHFDFYVTLPESISGTGGSFYILSGGASKTEQAAMLPSATPLPHIYDAVYKADYGHYVFGKALENEGDLMTEWGIVYSETNENPVIGGDECLELKALHDVNDKGQYGILMMFKNKSNYYVRAYATYEDEASKAVTVYSDTMNVKEEE